MKIPWLCNQCILCLKRGDLSEEHVIPKSIGGRLTANFLCQTCNSNLGRAVENVAKYDPSIRIALENLSRDIPELYSSITERQPFYGNSQAGRVPGYFRNGHFLVQPIKMADNSLVKPTEDAKKTIKTILERQGCTKSEIERVLSKFDYCPSNKITEIYPGLEIAKWDIEKIELNFESTSLMNPLIPLKIAFEFIACHLGESICALEPQLEEIRKVFAKQDTSDNECYQVERLNAGEYKPFHGIVLEGNNSSHAQVQVRLFGWLAFRVHFRRLKVHAPRCAYTHFLDTNIEDLRIVEDKMYNSPNQ